MKEDTRTGRSGVTEEDKGESARGGHTNIMMKNGARRGRERSRGHQIHLANSATSLILVWFLSFFSPYRFVSFFKEKFISLNWNIFQTFCFPRFNLGSMQATLTNILVCFFKRRSLQLLSPNVSFSNCGSWLARMPCSPGVWGSSPPGPSAHITIRWMVLPASRSRTAGCKNWRLYQDIQCNLRQHSWPLMQQWFQE